MMGSIGYYLVFLMLSSKCAAEVMYTTDFRFQVDPGSRTCFFEKGKAGQMMEVYYQVLDGQHGDLDISMDVIDPTGNIIVSDFKKPENSVIMDLLIDGDFSFCLDNTFSVMNSKLVFINVMLENQQSGNVTEAETVVGVLENDRNHGNQTEALHWTGTDVNDEQYYVPVADIADSMSRTLKHVSKARHMLYLYAASKSRDSYLAIEGTFMVAMWSAIQISCMCAVGLGQVCMIKKLF